MIPVTEKQVANIDVEAEVVELFQLVKGYGKAIGFDGEPSEMNVFFRVSAILLEKLVDLQERAANVKMVKEFQDTIIEIMEDMPPDIRAEFMRRLRAKM
jgi:hypothetical protein